MGSDLSVPLAAMMDRLARLMDEYGAATVAVSGGVDSMTLASFAHRTLGREGVRMVHAVSPAVPRAATARVRARGRPHQSSPPPHGHQYAIHSRQQAIPRSHPPPHVRTLSSAPPLWRLSYEGLIRRCRSA